MRLHQCYLYILLGLLIGTSLQTSAATKEQAVKAGFVYNVTNYVVWPSVVADAKEFNLCVFGDAQLGGALKALKGKLVLGKPLALRRWVKSKDLATCHMIFIAEEDVLGRNQALQAVHHLPVLTMSDAEGFIHHGGMVGLVRNGTKVGFEVNLEAVKVAGLSMSAQLLKLAKTVEGFK